MKLSGADIRAIAVETANVLEHRQREAGKRLSERLKGWTPTVGIPEKSKPQETAHREPNRIIGAYYKKASHDGLPAGVSRTCRSKANPYKASFRSKHLGVYASVEEATVARKEAERQFDLH